MERLQEREIMKTLDEVIKAIECDKKANCEDCPYYKKGKTTCDGDFETDALYFLKELRYILDNLVWVKPEEKGHWEIRSLMPEDDERTER